MMDTGIFIAVPEDLANKILCEGYQCSRRRRVPARRNRDGALRAYGRSHGGRAHVLLEAQLPMGVATTRHKDGIKLEIQHLPAGCLTAVNRSHSFSTMPSSISNSCHPLTRTASQRLSPPGPQMPGTSFTDRQRRLQRGNVQILYHATSQSNAESICQQKAFHAGTRGMLGPGIYFSKTASSARRYCQCRTGFGPRVVLRCEVNLGSVKRVSKGRDYTGQDLIADGCDSFADIDRDCFMLPDNRDGQINMDTVFIDHNQ